MCVSSAILLFGNSHGERRGQGLRFPACVVTGFVLSHIMYRSTTNTTTQHDETPKATRPPSFAVSRYQLPFLAVNCSLSLSVNYFLSLLHDFSRYQMLFLAVKCFFSLLISVSRCQLLSIAVDCRFSLSTAFFRSPSLPADIPLSFGK